MQEKLTDDLFCSIYSILPFNIFRVYAGLVIPRKKSSFVKDAIWISNTSLNDFLKCPRAYYLKNIYRDPKTGFRLQVASPYLTLGTVVHDSIKQFLENQDKQSIFNLEEIYRNIWRNFREKRGGFTSLEEEAEFGKRGLKMIENFKNNVGKLEKARSLPHMPKYPLAEDIILTGNMDYIGQCDNGTLCVVDFKTGSKDEDDPIQLYIYAILTENFFGLDVSKASFWYLDRDSLPKEIVLDPLEPKIGWLIDKGLQMKEALEKNNWICCKQSLRPDGLKEDLCRECKLYQAIIDGQGEFLYSDKDHKKDIYYLKN